MNPALAAAWDIDQNAIKTTLVRTAELLTRPGQHFNIDYAKPFEQGMYSATPRPTEFIGNEYSTITLPPPDERGLGTWRGAHVQHIVPRLDAHRLDRSDARERLHEERLLVNPWQRRQRRVRTSRK
jgi:hypothetical protein